MSKLYKVEITRTICVLAENQIEAEYRAIRHEGDEVYNDPDEVHITEIKKPEDVPAEWLNSLPHIYPFGAPELTIAQRLKTAV
jgi:hypothetical protein